MTDTIGEELIRLVNSCEDAVVGLKELEDLFTADFKDIDSLIKRFEWTRGNKPATAEDARTLSLLVRKAIDGNKMNVELTRILTLLVLQLSLLVQVDPGMPLRPEGEASPELADWFRQWEKVRKAWDEVAEK